MSLSICMTNIKTQMNQTELTQNADFLSIALELLRKDGLSDDDLETAIDFVEDVQYNLVKAADE